MNGNLTFRAEYATQVRHVSGPWREKHEMERCASILVILAGAFCLRVYAQETARRGSASSTSRLNNEYVHFQAASPTASWWMGQRAIDRWQPPQIQG